MAFTKGLWNRISEIYEAIIDHPFNRELAQGTLPAEKFAFYIKQDALYLVDFARVWPSSVPRLSCPGGSSTSWILPRTA